MTAGGFGGGFPAQNNGGFAGNPQGGQPQEGQPQQGFGGQPQQGGNNAQRAPQPAQFSGDAHGFGVASAAATEYVKLKDLVSQSDPTNGAVVALVITDRGIDTFNSADYGAKDRANFDLIIVTMPEDAVEPASRAGTMIEGQSDLGGRIVGLVRRNIQNNVRFVVGRLNKEKVKGNVTTQLGDNVSPQEIENAKALLVLHGKATPEELGGLSPEALQWIEQARAQQG